MGGFSDFIGSGWMRKEAQVVRVLPVAPGAVLTKGLGSHAVPALEYLHARARILASLPGRFSSRLGTRLAVCRQSAIFEFGRSIIEISVMHMKA